MTSETPESKSEPSERARIRDKQRRRALQEGELTVMLFDKVARGHSCSRIASEQHCSVDYVRRLMRKELDRRKPDKPEDHIVVQIGRMEKAVGALTAALDRGDWRAANALPKIAAMLDRYHGLAADFDAAPRAEAQALLPRAEAKAAQIPNFTSTPDGAEGPAAGA